MAKKLNRKGINMKVKLRSFKELEKKGLTRGGSVLGISRKLWEKMEKRNSYKVYKVVREEQQVVYHIRYSNMKWLVMSTSTKRVLKERKAQ